MGTIDFVPLGNFSRNLTRFVVIAGQRIIDPSWLFRGIRLCWKLLPSLRVMDRVGHRRQVRAAFSVILPMIRCIFWGEIRVSIVRY
jgi:hypothetical protein